MIYSAGLALIMHTPAAAPQSPPKNQHPDPTEMQLPRPLRFPARGLFFWHVWTLHFQEVLPQLLLLILFVMVEEMWQRAGKQARAGSPSSSRVGLPGHRWRWMNRLLKQAATSLNKRHE